MGTGVFPQGYSGRRVLLTIHAHLVPRLRMSGAVPLLSLFVAWTRKILFLTADKNVEEGVVFVV